MKKRIAKKFMRPFPRGLHSRFQKRRAEDFFYRKANKYTGFGLTMKGDEKKFIKHSDLYISAAIGKHDIIMTNRVDGIVQVLQQEDFSLIRNNGVFERKNVDTRKI